MLLDTTFLIDLHRETARRSPGPAFAFLESHPNEALSIAIVTWGEVAEGFADADAERCRELLKPYPIVSIDESVAWRYSRISRALREAGTPIGDNDLWIAATALAGNSPLVTRDAAHFARIPGLRLLVY